MPTHSEGGAACSVAAAEIVVVDTSPVRNFVEAGAQRAFAGYLGSRVRIRVDVSREMEEAAGSLPGLQSFLREWPPNDPVDLPRDLKQKAADILGFITLDDVRHGKNLAKPRRLEVIDTPALIVEMVRADAMSRELGNKVWRATFSDRSKWPAFDERLRQVCDK